MSDWFTNLASQAMQFADSLAENLANQAAEAQHQIEEEQRKLQSEEELKNNQMRTLSSLPWETDDESLAILSQDLMEQIFQLSVNDENFITAAGNARDVYFNFKDFVPAAMNLLKLDSNLARMHSKLSPKMDEEVFWFNYFCRVMYLRDSIGMNGSEAKQASTKYSKGEIIFQPKAVVAKKELPVPPAARAKPPKAPSAQPSASPSSSSASRKSNKSGVVITRSEEEEALAAEVHAALRAGDESDQFSGEVIDESELLGDEDIDLGDLDDLLDIEESVDFEQIGKSECNDETEEELEAQIAKELAMNDD